MAKLVDTSVFALAELWMKENRGVFPPNEFDALTQRLAEELQSTVEDFVNPEYLDINLESLYRSRASEAYKLLRGERP